jgi:hypothetical protein
LKSENKVQIPGGSAQEITNQGNLYQTENGLRKNFGSPHEVRAQKQHTYFVRVSAIFCEKGAKTARLLRECFCNFCKPILFRYKTNKAHQLFAFGLFCLKPS